jgi:ATP-dependent RNA helicase DeaD
MKDDKQDDKIEGAGQEAEGEILEETSLEELPRELQEACARAGWTSLMPVQARVLPGMIKGMDLMVQSRTGSGKTGAFLLPILHRLDTKKDSCQALVLDPTRELAVQVAREAEVLAGEAGLRTAAIYGGAGFKPQLDALKQGAHLVVGTPGRILDHLERGTLRLDDLQIFVFDEADRMLSIGFYPDMREIHGYMPKDRHVNTLMFSATYPPHVMRLADQFMRDPVFVSLSREAVHVVDVPHVYYQCPPMEKDRALMRIIEIENPASALIFCNTKNHVHYVAGVLKNFGYDADELSGDLSQDKREKILGRVKAKNLRFLVATDVAARGIDIRELSHVIMYEPPDDQEVYIHRAGRTGRAGAGGEVVTLVDVIQELELKKVASRFGIDLEKRELPSEEEVQQVVSKRAAAMLETRLRKTDNLRRERMQRFLPLIEELAGHPEEALLVAQLVDEFYQERMHSPPEIPPEKKEQQPEKKRRKRRPRRKGGKAPSENK